MRRLVISAAMVSVAAIPAAEFAPVRAQAVITAIAPNNTPLFFGMDANEAAVALGTTLQYVSGRRGNELYLALPNVKGAALSYRNDGLYLQFRRGRLAGWKGDWRANRPCCN